MCCFEGLKAAALILCERTQRTDVTLFRLSWDLAPVRKRRQTNQGRANWALKHCVISAIDDGAICHVDRFALCFNTADNTSMFLRLTPSFLPFPGVQGDALRTDNQPFFHLKTSSPKRPA